MTNDFKVRGKCEVCHKTRWFIRKRKVALPGIGAMTTSKQLFCNKCAKLLGKVK